MERRDVWPFLAMVFVQISFAGLNIASKLAMNSGMKPLVLVTYRQIFATFALTPFAYLFEWKTRSKITRPLLFQLFLCSLTGITGNQVFYFVGLEKSTSTVGCALNNILPATTFILAVLFRQETLGLKKIFGLAKVLGTVVCLGGAMLLSFYHGEIINIGKSSIQWNYAEKMGDTSSTNKTNSFVGPLFVMAGAASWSLWFIIQAKVSSKFSAPYTSTLLMCLMASIEVMAIAAFNNRELSLWSLRSPGRLFAALYAGIVCSGLAMCLTSWSISRKGALYVSVFSPLSLVLVTVLSWALMNEDLYIGTAVGSLMIVGGLYAVLWGKDKEAKLKNIEDVEALNLNLWKVARRTTTTAKTMRTMKGEKDDDDLELQLPGAAAAAVVTNPIKNNASNIIEN